MAVLKNLLQEKIFQNNPPENLTEGDRHLFKIHRQTKAEEAKLYELSNVIYLPEVIIIHKGLFRTVLTNRNLRNLRYLFKVFRKYLLRRTENLKGAYLLVIDDWSNGYYHWITDVLQRLYMVKDFAANASLLLPEKFRDNAYMMDSLSLFNFKITFYIDTRNLRIEKLLIPAHAGTSGTFHYDIINALPAYIKKNLKIVKGEYFLYEKIYISRSRAGRRRIINEEELIDLLSKRGFHTIHTEDYSFFEQVRLFSHCKYLVSLHGAGLTNEMFMNRGCKVLEIRHPQDNLNNCYYLLATALGLRYYYFLSDSDNHNPHDADSTVNINLFRECLNAFHFKDENSARHPHF